MKKRINISFWAKKNTGYFFWKLDISIFLEGLFAHLFEISSQLKP
jgi:hypothetical protein